MKAAFTEAFQPIFKPAGYCPSALNKWATSLEGLL